MKIVDKILLLEYDNIEDAIVFLYKLDIVYNKENVYFDTELLINDNKTFSIKVIIYV